jgi:uncharacterized protein (TIGR04255 family)
VQGTETVVIPSVYNKPPIVEAVVELRFAPGSAWTEALLSSLVEQLRRAYPGAPQRRNQFQLQAHVQGDAVATASRLSFHQVMLPTADGKAIVGVGENLLSVHVLAPYPGWGSFLPRVREALAIYRELARPEGLLLVGVRYIDQIIVPDGADTNLVEYFPCLPPRPESMPGALDGFHVLTQAHEPKDNFTAVLTMASVPSQDARLAVLYDLNVVRTFERPAALDELQQHADFLHARQRRIFEDSITPSTRRLFE